MMRLVVFQCKSIKQHTMHIVHCTNPGEGRTGMLIITIIDVIIAVIIIDVIMQNYLTNKPGGR